MKSRCTPLDSTKKLTIFQPTYSGKFHIIFFDCCSRFVCCKDRGLHFYVNDIRDRNVNLPINSKYKKFALKSRCTPLDSTKKLTIFGETYSGEFYTLFFDYCSKHVCCKDRGLHFYVNDIRDRNVNLPIESKCKKFALKSRCTSLDSTKNLTTFRETYSGEFYISFFDYYSRFVFCKNRGLHSVADTKNVRKGGVGVKPPPWDPYFPKTLLLAQRRLLLCIYFLLVNLST